jgi:predicted ABC-class ATPase
MRALEAHKSSMVVVHVLHAVTHATLRMCRYVRAGLFYKTQDVDALRRHVDCVEDTEALRRALPGMGLVAFVGNGSILPR